MPFIRVSMPFIRPINLTEAISDSITDAQLSGVALVRMEVQDCECGEWQECEDEECGCCTDDCNSGECSDDCECEYHNCTHYVWGDVWCYSCETSYCDHTQHVQDYKYPEDHEHSWTYVFLVLTDKVAELVAGKTAMNTPVPVEDPYADLPDDIEIVIGGR